MIMLCYKSIVGKVLDSHGSILYLWWSTWSGDSVNISKLALSLLIPDLRQLGHVHPGWFISLTVGTEERNNVKDIKQWSSN